MIEYRNIDLTFGEQRVLSGFSATIERGEKVLFSGESGTGKSSLLRMILGFTPPTAGSVHFEGEEITPHQAWRIRKDVSYVPQAADLGAGTGDELLRMILGLRHNADCRRDDATVDTWLAALKLDRDLLSKDLADLSGGEKQRIGLLVALLLDRSLFLLDEATASLDDTMKRRIVALFAERAERTVVAVSHDTVWRESGAFRVVDLPAPADLEGRIHG